MDELSFAKPEMAWLAFVVGVIVLLAAVTLGRRGKLLARLGSGPVVERLIGSFSPRVAAWRLVCIGLAMSLLVGALVGPRYGLRETEVANSGIDVVFVVDGSVLPTALGVNPSETIYAIAHRAVDTVAGASA